MLHVSSKTTAKKAPAENLNPARSLGGCRLSPAALPVLSLLQAKLRRKLFKMKNDEGEVVDLYIPRKW